MLRLVTEEETADWEEMEPQDIQAEPERQPPSSESPDGVIDDASDDAESPDTGELPPVQHTFTHFALTIHPRRVAVASWPRRAESPGRLWLTAADACNAALPAPIRKIVALLQTPSL